MLTCKYKLESENPRSRMDDGNEGVDDMTKIFVPS